MVDCALLLQNWFARALAAVLVQAGNCCTSDGIGEASLLSVSPLEVPLPPDGGISGGGAGEARLGLDAYSGWGAGGRGRGGGGVARTDCSDRKMDASGL